MPEMEVQLRQLLRGCKSKAEADRVVAAYIRESKGRDNLNDKILLSRKRRELGLQVCTVVVYFHTTTQLTQVSNVSQMAHRSLVLISF